MPDNYSVRIDIQHDPDALRKIMKHGDTLLSAAAGMVRDRAKVKVSPGVGPGPHPHRTPHVDTGQLAASLTTYGPYSEGQNRVIEVGGDGSVWWGKWLEVGWTSKAGNWFRYPFLIPALKEVIPAIGRTLRRIF